MDSRDRQDTRAARPRVVYRPGPAGRRVCGSQVAAISESARRLRSARARFVECHVGSPGSAHLVTPVRSRDTCVCCLAHPEGNPRLARAVALGCLDLRSTHTRQSSRLTVRPGSKSRAVVSLRPASGICPVPGCDDSAPIDRLDRAGVVPRTRRTLALTTARDRPRANPRRRGRSGSASSGDHSSSRRRAWLLAYDP